VPVEVCDGIDNDNDGLIDEGFDVDGDGFKACGGDCNDTDPAINPNTVWYQDFDGDGYGNLSSSIQQCSQPTGPPEYVLNNTDYDDFDPNIYPGGPPARITGSIPVYYWTLQEIYDAASPGDTIEVQAVTFNEDLNIWDEKLVSLKCGYNVTFSGNTGNTILNGNMSITNGTITIDSLIIQ
jgi:hypothetical protein